MEFGKVYNILSIGDKIELHAKSNHLDDKIEQKVYVSQLLDLLDGNKANLAMPIVGRRIVPMEIGESYSLYFYTKNGLYHCECVVIDRYKNQNIYIAVVEFTSDLEKNQRRQFFRWECIIDFVYRVVTENEIKLIERYNLEQNDNDKKRIKIVMDKIPEKWVNGIITDISGGGLRFTSEIKEDKINKLLLSFSLFTASGLKTFKQLGNIISVEPIINKKSMYEYRVEFLDISKEDRETIIRYVFDEERKKRRKERETK